LWWEGGGGGRVGYLRVVVEAAVRAALEGVVPIVGADCGDCRRGVVGG